MEIIEDIIWVGSHSISFSALVELERNRVSKSILVL